MGEPSEIINSVPTDVDAKELKNVSDAMKIAMKDEQDISIEILVVMALLLLALASGLVLKKSGHKYLQEAALTVIIGALAGLWLKQYRITKQIESITGDFHSLFMIFLLPPIIFESGYNMNKKHFFNNIGTILMFSFVGTFLSIFLSAIMFWGAGLTGYSTEFSPKAAFAFGSLISATDPVSVLAIFGEMGADANLYSIVFGESIFNDAVAIVVYETVIHSGQGGRSFTEEVGMGIGNFCLVFLGSLVIGAVIAFIVAFMLKRQKAHLDKKVESTKNLTINSKRRQLREVKLRQKNIFTEITVMMLAPWVSYIAASSFKLSGIVSILTNGVFLSYYAKPNISVQASKILKTVYEVVAYTSETIVFLFFGIGCFAIDHPYSEMGWGLPIWTLINLNFARAINIGVVGLIVNCTRAPQNRLNWKTLSVMWYSGLRGAMAYALALQAATKLETGPIILLDTLIYSVFTIIIQASFLNPILNKAGVVSKPGEKKQESQESEAPESPGVKTESSASKKKKCDCSRRVKNLFHKLDTKYIAPFFIKDFENVDINHRMNNLDESLVASCGQTTYIHSYMEEAGDLEEIQGEVKQKRSRVVNIGPTEVVKAEREQPRVSPVRSNESTVKGSNTNKLLLKRQRTSPTKSPPSKKQDTGPTRKEQSNEPVPNPSNLLSLPNNDKRRKSTRQPAIQPMLVTSELPPIHQERETRDIFQLDD